MFVTPSTINKKALVKTTKTTKRKPLQKVLKKSVKVVAKKRVRVSSSKKLLKTRTTIIRKQSVKKQDEYNSFLLDWRKNMSNIISNPMMVPKLEKVIVNVANKNKAELEQSQRLLQVVTGQKPSYTKAKKSISDFKIRKGDKIGVMVTLRKQKAYYFLKKMINEVLPKIPNFSSFSAKVCKQGKRSCSFGIAEQLFFSEVSFEDVKIVKGLGINVVFSKNGSLQFNRLLLEKIGFRFSDVIFNK